MRAGTTGAPAVDPLAPQDAAPPPPVDMSMGMDMGSLNPAGQRATPIETPAPSDTPVASAPPAVPDDAATLDAPVAPGAATPGGPAGDTTADGAAAPLSDIIVTTNKAEIDLTDPDVRAMLQELVRDEIALADVYRKGGQTLDAILQLTEAEKACQALGDADQAQCIQAMLEELR